MTEPRPQMLWRTATLFMVLIVLWQPMTFADFYARRLDMNMPPNVLLLGWASVLVVLLLVGVWRRSWLLLYRLGPWLGALIFGHVVWGAFALDVSSAYALSNVGPLSAAVVFTIVAGQARYEVEDG